MAMSNSAAEGDRRGGGRAAARPLRFASRGEKLSVLAHRLAFLVLPALAIVLFLAGGDPSRGSDPAFEPAELSSSELPSQAAGEPLDAQPALKRGGVAMAAVEASRRKLKSPQRPTSEPLILTSRFIADGLPGTQAWPPTWSSPPVKPAQPDGAFLARGPPLWNCA